MGWSLVIYGLLIFLPAYRLFELVAPGTPPIRNTVGSWISVSYLALVVTLGAVLPLVTSKAKDDPYGIKQSQDKLTEAEKFWDAGERPKAIKEYKHFLKSEGRIHFRSELPGVYRRVIEYEADNGDASEAGDWALRALDEWPGQPMQLSFQSTKAKGIWGEVEAAWHRREEKQREQWREAEKQPGKQRSKK